MTAALEGGEWSAARPGRTLPPGKIRYTFYRRLGGPQDRSGRAENLVPTGIRSRTVQPVAQSLYRLSYRAHTLQSKANSICEKDQLDAQFLVINLTRYCSSHNVLATRYRIYLFSRLYNVATSSCAHLTIIFFLQLPLSFQSSSINPFSSISPLIPSAQVSLGLPRFLLPGGLHFITSFGSLPSSIR